MTNHYHVFDVPDATNKQKRNKYTMWLYVKLITYYIDLIRGFFVTF